MFSWSNIRSDPQIPRARQVIRHVSVEEAAGLVRAVLAAPAEEGRALLEAVVQKAEEAPLVTKHG